MNLNSISPQQSNFWYSKTTDMKTSEVTNQLFSIIKTVGNKESSNLPQTNSVNIWDDLSKTHNVRNATFDEIKTISKALYDAGEISLKEVAVLTFDFERATNYLKQNSPVSIPDSFNMYKTTSNSNGERDWIAEFEARAQEDFKYGNLLGYHSNKKILTILKQLETL